MIAYIHQKPRNIIKASVGYGMRSNLPFYKVKIFFGYIICPTYPQIHVILLGYQQHKIRHELAKRHMNRLPKHSIESVAKPLDSYTLLKHNINQVQ